MSAKINFTLYDSFFPLYKKKDSPLANVASEIEERRCDLIDRHKHLRDKVAMMERSIPALITCNMWKMADEGAGRDTAYRIVRQIVDIPDPVDGLLARLNDAVNDHRLEMAQLHDKIIDADVKLEETTMELESLELANKETEEKLRALRHRLSSTSSLRSIHSEDLICLKKIRQLAEEELNLKSCIKELENKETTYRRQMRQFLPCKKFQRDNEKVNESFAYVDLKIVAQVNARVFSHTFSDVSLKHHSCDNNTGECICNACFAARKLVCEEKRNILSTALCANCSVPSLTISATAASETLRLVVPDMEHDGISDKEFCECYTCSENSEEST
ncbi:PREDICTED: uncharacterized protein LOC106749691 [Dinoponera quadriceps]|uniref:Uncharacterized protein LOC106749691 n=1 Tax=Dinoponera quadriceps TaxID=609295 RepID=A0A6P3Y216_DINQU|nr:PREDICTED: uncharacterized protein LOC106749691 [Dinoponera quadriceps]